MKIEDFIQSCVDVAVSWRASSFRIDFPFPPALWGCNEPPTSHFLGPLSEGPLLAHGIHLQPTKTNKFPPLYSSSKIDMCENASTDKTFLNAEKFHRFISVVEKCSRMDFFSMENKDFFYILNCLLQHRCSQSTFWSYVSREKFFSGHRGSNWSLLNDR